MTLADTPWVALLVALVALELAARVAPRRIAVRLVAPVRLAGRVATSRTGRLVLLLAWGFAGVHLFARHRLVA